MTASVFCGPDAADVLWLGVCVRAQAEIEIAKVMMHA
jgi:hypothetical protein